MMLIPQFITECGLQILKPENWAVGNVLQSNRTRTPNSHAHWTSQISCPTCSSVQTNGQELVRMKFTNVVQDLPKSKDWTVDLNMSSMWAQSSILIKLYLFTIATLHWWRMKKSLIRNNRESEFTDGQYDWADIIDSICILLHMINRQCKQSCCDQPLLADRHTKSLKLE